MQHTVDKTVLSVCDAAVELDHEIAFIFLPKYSDTVLGGGGGTLCHKAYSMCHFVGGFEVAIFGSNS